MTENVCAVVFFCSTASNHVSFFAVFSECGEVIGFHRDLYSDYLSVFARFVKNFYLVNKDYYYEDY